MNRVEITELRQERKKLHEQAFALHNKPGATKEDRAKVNVMLDEVDALKTKIDAMEAEEAENARASARFETIGSEFRSAAPPREKIDPAGGADEETTARKAQARQHKAWSNFLKYGWNSKPTQSGHYIKGISDEDRKILTEGRVQLSADDQEKVNAELRRLGIELRDMGSGNQGAYPGATTGFFVPVGFVDRITEALKYYGPMLTGGPGNPEIFDTATGQPLPFPTDNDTTVTGELIGENTQVTSQDVAIGQITLGAYKYSTKLVKVSIELLQDSAFDLESYLVRKFGIRLGRILNNHFTVGTGSSQPNGIVTASTLGYTALGSSSNDGTSAGTNTIGSDDLINLEHSVDILYRPGAKFMMHDDTLRQIKTVKDKFGRPLWMPGLAVQAPDSINSFSYLINNDMDKLQTGAASSPPVTRKTVLFGQLPLYTIRRVKDMTVLRLEERFADFGQVAFLAFWRGDGNLIDAGTRPVKYLANIF